MRPGRYWGPDDVAPYLGHDKDLILLQSVILLPLFQKGY